MLGLVAVDIPGLLGKPLMQALHLLMEGTDIGNCRVLATPCQLPLFLHLVHRLNGLIDSSLLLEPRSLQQRGEGPLVRD